MSRADAMAKSQVFHWEWTLFMASLAAGCMVLGFWPDIASEMSMQSWAGFSAWTHRNLWSVTENSPLLIACLPCVLMLGLAVVFQLLWDRPPNWIRLPVATIFRRS